ncbi:MAG: sensor domain-containing diguanylate cyclase [Gammaproteobacteria bacterium]|nr:MAG: sensor domain-containing diguanylate cyclase [Gammaproteobacteria bacterium]
MTAPTYASLGKYMDLLLDAICVVDSDGRFIYVSAGCERIFGYRQEELIGLQMIDLVFPEDREITLQTVKRIVAGEAQPQFENRYVRKDGEIVHIMWSARWSEADQCRVAVARDITGRKRTEVLQAALYAISEAAHAADDLQALYKSIHCIISGLLPAINFSIALYDQERDQVSFPYHVNELVPQLQPQKIDSNTPWAYVIQNGQPLLFSSTDENITYDLPIPKNYVHTWLGVPLKSRKNTIGALVVQSYCGNAHYTEKDQELLQFVSTQVATAIERKQIIERLQSLALYDQLTQLPNRRLFHDRLQSALTRAARSGSPLSIFYLDLEKFKAVNDAFGHAMGDLLLEKVARRLEQCVRDSDTVARMGGDEFVVLLENINFPEKSIELAENIRNAFGAAFDLMGEKVHILPSIGISSFPLHGSDEKQLLRYADDAMYAAKNKSN